MHEWKLRSQPGYLREQVFLRDQGVCAACSIDTVSEFRRFRASRGASRSALVAHWGLGKRKRKSLWDADHIIPVAEGGGECDLSNLQTLCLRCHQQATRALRVRLQKQKTQAETPELKKAAPRLRRMRGCKSMLMPCSTPVLRS